MGQLTASYDAGTAGAPLVGDTIGVALAKMVVAQPDVEALVSRHQGVRLSYSRARRAGRAGRAGLARRRDRDRRPGRHLGADMRRMDLAAVRAARAVGAILVNVNPAYRPNELAYALRHSGVRLLVTARSFKTSDYLAMLAGVRGELPDLEMVVTIDGESAGGSKDLDWPALVELGNGIPADQVRYRELQLDTDDPINIQYTSGTTGNPKGATLTHHNILNNAQAMAAEHGVHVDRPRLHPSAAVPLLRHGDRQPGLHRVGIHDGVPRRRLRSAGDARSAGRGAVHCHVRRPDDVHRDARAPAVRGVRHVRRCGPGSWRARHAPSRS